MLPGETALLGTTTRASAVQLAHDSASSDWDWVDAEPLGATDDGLAVAIPSEWAPGAHLARVRGPDGGNWSRPTTLNAPEPWFLYGDQGARASPAHSGPCGYANARPSEYVRRRAAVRRSAPRARARERREARARERETARARERESARARERESGEARRETRKASSGRIAPACVLR